MTADDEIRSDAAYGSRPIIFLDMDGVLSSPRAYMSQQKANIDQHDKWIDPVAVRYLNLLCEGAKALVVVSWVWRIRCSRMQFYDQLNRHGFTGELHEDWRTNSTDRGFRGDEVAEWLSRHAEVSCYVILDDDSDFHPDQPRVQTDGTDGFLYRHFVAAQKLLSIA